MAGARVELELVARADKATRELEKFTKNTQDQLDGIKFNTAISAIVAGFEIASKAAQAATKAFDSTIGEAIQFEVVTQRLGQALKNAGDFTEGAVQEFVDYADALEAATGVQDDLILNSIVLAKNFNLSNKEARDATNAALELAAATGDSLDSAIAQVAGTISGKYSKELVKLVPELKSLSREQLIAGEGFALIQQRLNGAALAAGSTTQAEFNKLKNELSDFGKEIGKVFLPSINTAIKGLNDLFKTIVNLRAAAAEKVAVGLTLRLQAQTGTSGLGDLQRAEGERAAQAAAEAAAERGAETARINAEKEKEFREKAQREYESIRQDLARNGYTQLEKLEVDFSQKRQIINDAFQANLIKSDTERLRLIANLEKEYAQQSLELRTKNNEKIAQNAAEELTKAILEARALTADEGNAAGLGLGRDALKGEAGAKNVVASAGGAVANAFLPGAGQIVKEILSILGDGPDKVKKTVTEFIQGVPRIITNILTSIPTLLITLFKEIPKSLTTFLKEGIPEIIGAFIDGVPQIIEAFLKGIPDLFIGVIQAVFKIIPKLISGIFELVKNLPVVLFEALKYAIVELVNFVGNIFSDVGNFFGFAEGGRVPNDPKFEGDRFPARLNAGEQVLDKDLSSSLERFLNGNGGGGGGGPTRVTIQIGQRELANVMLDLNQRGFRTA